MRRATALLMNNKSRFRATFIWVGLWLRLKSHSREWSVCKIMQVTRRFNVSLIVTHNNNLMRLAKRSEGHEGGAEVVK